MGPPFRDHFSKQADVYAEYRPIYPGELFAYLASIAPCRKLAWDVGTGNGQAALELARHFDHVFASDPSADQIAHTVPHPDIEYRVERAEDNNLPDRSVDLVTGAMSVHWFDLDVFYRQVRRVLRPRGILAVWVYGIAVIDPSIDPILDRYYNLLSGYFPERFHYVAEHYATLPFPFSELTPPMFEMTAEWDLTQFVGFLDTWSATRRYAEVNNTNPIRLIWRELVAAWGVPEQRRIIRWPLYLRVGQVDTRKK